MSSKRFFDGAGKSFVFWLSFLMLWGGGLVFGGNAALDVLSSRPTSEVAPVSPSRSSGSSGYTVLPSEKRKDKSPYFHRPGYTSIPGYENASENISYITAHNIRLSEALDLLGKKDHVTYYIVGSDIGLPDSSYKIRSFRDLQTYLKKTTPYIVKREKGKFKRGSLVRVLVYRKGFLAKEKLSLFGETSLYRALGVLGRENINIIFDKNVPNKKIRLGISTKNLDRYVLSVCEAADVWCDFTRQSLKVSNKKQFVVSSPIDGSVVFDSQESAGSGGGGEGASGSDMTKSFHYKISGVSYKDFPKILARNFPDVDFGYSTSGFYTFMATPSQYRRIMKYFAEDKARKKVLYAEIQLLRVDLKDEFKWGIDWTKIAAFAFGGKDFGVGLLAPSFMDKDSRGWVGVVDPKRAKIIDEIIKKKSADGSLTSDEYDALNKSKLGGVVSFFSQFGDVHHVDSWFNQMVTGVPLPFSNYRLVRYFTVGSSDAGGSGGTQTTVEIKQDEVGFKGVITVNKNNDGYLVEGYVDQSFVDGYIEMQMNGGIMKAPNIVGKSVRIQTKLARLGDTIVVGGFRGKGLEKGEGGVPILKDIPILGYLFKNKKDMTENSEFVILITLRKGREGTLNGI